MGDLQGAEDSFRAALRHNPRFALAHYKLAELLGGKLPEKDLAAQRRLLEEGGVDRRTTIVVALRPGPSPGRAGRVCRGRRAPRSGQRPATVRVAQARPGVRPAAVRVPGRPHDRGLHARFLRAAAYFPVGGPWVGKRTAGVRRGAAAIRHDAHRADLGQPFPGLRLRERSNWPATPWPRSADKAQDAIEGLCRLDRPTARRLASRHLERLRALSPAALRIVDKMPDNYLLLGLLAGLFPRAKFIHCRRDLRDVAVSCWMTHFLDVRWANNQQHIASRFHAIPTAHGALAEGFAGAPLGSGLRGDRGRSGGRGPEPRGLVRPGVGARLPGVPPGKRPVRTASAVQVRQPVYTTSVGRWRHYEQLLVSLLDALPGGR